MLLVVDALADHGASDGVDGSASSLDLAVRAAAAIAEHHIRTGDRVALRVVGRGGEQVGYGAGRRHLRRIQSTLATVRPGELRDPDAGVLQLQVTGGTVVIVMSPMLAESIGTVAATLTRRGVPIVVIDTLPPDARPDVPDGTDPVLAEPGLADAPGRAHHRARPARLAGLSGGGVARAGHHRRRAAPTRPPSPAAAGGVAMTPRVKELSVSQIVLRALVVLGPVVAVLATGPAGHWPPWWMVVAVAALAAGFAGAARVAGRCRHLPRGPRLVDAVARRRPGPRRARGGRRHRGRPHRRPAGVLRPRDDGGRRRADPDLGTPRHGRPARRTSRVGAGATPPR